MKNSVGRRLLTTAFVAGAVGLTTPNLAVTKNNQDIIVETKKSDRRTDKFLEINAYNIGTYSFEHNKRLDRLYLENCNLDESNKNKKANLNLLYLDHGTFGATIELQRAIDNEFLTRAIDSFWGHYTFTNEDIERTKPFIEKFQDWRKNTFDAELKVAEEELFDSQKIPSAENTIAIVDSHIKNNKFFNQQDINLYNKFCKDFETKQGNRNSVQAKSDLLAFKIHLINAMAFYNYFVNKTNMPENRLFMYYLSYEFINNKNFIKY